METKSKKKKSVFTLRVPIAMNEKLIKRAESIGITKNAVILSIIHKEFSKDAERKNQVRE